MKIEKISDTQIRCTLSKQDLADRELKLSELAYGSDKAKALFREMMLQASYECGFEADDIPLMIEAIPISPESLVLVVTKVEDPDELDTRFSNFSSAPSSVIDEGSENDNSTLTNELLDCFGHLNDLIKEKGKSKIVPIKKEKKTEEEPNVVVPPTLAKAFSFPSLKAVTTLSSIIAPYYFGKNTLYKNPRASRYYLVIRMTKHTPEEFNRICNVIAEYGTVEQTDDISLAYYEEHYTPILRHDAVQTLSAL